MSITLLIEAQTWRKTQGLSARLKRAIHLALAGQKSSGSLSVLLASDARLRALNRAFRGKDEATNVLSFPAPDNGEFYLGDIAIAYGVTVKEARAQGKRLADHAVHLAVHGALHLLGFDHVKGTDARVMEKTETAILAKLGINDPYLPKAARRS